MSERFEVGEIAVIHGITHTDWSWANGEEVQIRSPLFIDMNGDAVYRIDSPALHVHYPGIWRFLCYPRHLRRRSPPPDWNAIAGTRELETA